MYYRTEDMEIRQFSGLSKDDLEKLLGAFAEETTGHVVVNPAIGYDVEELIDILDEHMVEHGIAPGGIYLDGNSAVGIGGFYYLEETGMYEIICSLAPGQERLTPAILNSLVEEAFDNLKMDKICARAIPASPFDKLLAEAGFAFLGERMFMMEGAGQIWNYYELEDERNLVSADSGSAYADNDWDAIF